MQVENAQHLAGILQRNRQFSASRFWPEKGGAVERLSGNIIRQAGFSLPRHPGNDAIWIIEIESYLQILERLAAIAGASFVNDLAAAGINGIDMDVLVIEVFADGFDHHVQQFIKIKRGCDGVADLEDG